MANRHIHLDTVLGIIVLILFVALSLIGSSPFGAIEAPIYEIGMKLNSSEDRGAHNIVLIEVDQKSLEKLGPWPWPRDRIADMLTLIDQNGAALVGLQLPLIDKQSGSGLKAIRGFNEKFKAYISDRKASETVSWVTENLRQLEEKLDQDRLLIESVRASGEVILPVLVPMENDGKMPGGRLDPSLVKNTLTRGELSAGLMERLAVDRLSLPFTDLAQAALGLGHSRLGSIGNGDGRAHQPVVAHGGALIPSFPLRLAIALVGQKPKQVIVEEDQIRMKGRTIPLIRGEMLIAYPNMTNPFPRYSFADLPTNKNGLQSLKGKTVLLGFSTADSLHLDTPVHGAMPEMELTARILDNIMNNRFISRSPFLLYAEVLLLLLLSGFAIFLFPRMGHMGRLGTMIGISVLVLVSGIILFSIMHIWVRTTYIVGCLVVLYLVVTIRQLASADKATRDAVETNRMMGLSFQSQGLFDLALDKFKKLPLDNTSRGLIYDLGLEFEKKQINDKALEVYEYINKEGGFRDLDNRIASLRGPDHAPSSESGAPPGDSKQTVDGKITKLGRYKVLGELGRGSMGFVYKALDPKINRLLAIKTIRFSDEFDGDVIQDIKERFFREAEIAGQLSHPSIVTIHDVGDYRDLTYMAMEFLEGEDLEKFVLKKNLLPLRRVLDIMIGVAEALDFAHKAHVIHRDIKPANIMLLKSGGVKVTDFGIAKAISSSRTKTGVILGTPNYMSPEQIMGQKIDQRSDIFSLGVLFYQLLTGETPFHGENLSALLYQITQVHQPPVRSLNPKIPKVCEKIIDRALAKDPAARFSSAGELAKFSKVLASKIDQLREKKPMRG